MEHSTIAIIIILLAMVSFALERIPLVATALLASLAMVLFGVMPVEEAYSGFGTNVVMMVAGMMIIGNALFETGVAAKFGDAILHTRFAKSEKSFMVMLMVVESTVLLFINNSAIVALMIPIIAAVASRSNGKITLKNVLMPVAFVAVIRGGITMSGSTPQVIGQTALTQIGLPQMGYFKLAWVGIPRTVMCIIYFATIGYALEKKVFKFDDKIDQKLLTPSAAGGGGFSKAKMWISSLVMAGSVIGFVSGTFSLGFWSLLGVTVLIATKCVTPKQAFGSVDWNTIGILGAAQGFATGLNVSGGGKVIAETMINTFGGVKAASPLLITTLFIIITAVLTNILSDTALAAIMCPIAANVAVSLGVSPYAMVIGVILATGGDFTPIATAGLTQSLVGGYRFMDYVKVLVPLWVLLVITTVIFSPIAYPF